jgi:hypothetical protein
VSDISQLSRISKLIRLLSSDKDHEALGAARALVRICDIHAVADCIEKHFQIPEESPRLRPWQRQAQWLLDFGQLWGSRERSFLTNILRQSYPPNAKQERWMRDIFNRRCAA